MNSVIVINDCEVKFEVVNSEIFTNSLNVAEVFEKQHQHIIAKIRELPKDDFNASNFRPVEYKDAKGEFRPCYNLTRDGFSLLVMGFTGEKAYKWKVEFINAFNKMEAMIKTNQININAKFSEVLTSLSEK
ncbi:Rha family transcriptional regulator [Campylobacter fetus]|uniref:Rha family transcriptional regulator n=1 Tax=Campylobacter fetus TaxID=196 RepID=UPI0003FC59CE